MGLVEMRPYENFIPPPKESGVAYRPSGPPAALMLAVTACTPAGLHRHG